MAKNKLKTHKGLAKVLGVRKSGSVKHQVAGKNHKLTHKSNASRRNRHHSDNISVSDTRRLKSLINK